jgi:hypothetical protein
MPAVQLVLFVVVATLALSLVTYLVFTRLRAGRRLDPSSDPAAISGRSGAASNSAARVPPPPRLICPACRREYPDGLKYCPADARALVPAGDPAVRSHVGGLTCPLCKRSFEGNKKFCPYDAEELIATALATARMARGAGPAMLPHAMGKICPHCAQRYESEATFCGRDGSELVSVN